jgi:hypothetical protein
MINFRFHLASLIAIFLALALGVVVGAGVIDRGVVDTLNSRLDSVERESSRIKDENRALGDENSRLTDAIQSAECYATSDRLLGEDVGLVAVRGVNEDRVNKTVAAVLCGGATVTGVLWVEEKWALANVDDAAKMADALGSSSKRAATLRTAAWKQLSERLQEPSPASETSPDLLSTLEDAGFVKFQTVGDSNPTTLAQFPKRGASLLLVVGNDANVPDKDIVVPGATAFTAAGIPLVVGEVYAEGQDAPARSSGLAPLRDGDLAKKVSTVDDLDQPYGPLTAALALAGLHEFPPRVGHYGLSTDTLLPDISQ